MFNFIKYLGAAYLIYIGYKSLTSKSSHLQLEDRNKKTDISKFAAIRMGFITLVKSRLAKVQHHAERFIGVVLIALGIKVALSSSK